MLVSMAIELAAHAAVSGTPSLADWITAGGTAVTAIVAVLALLYARGQISEAKLARVQVRDLEIERAQPYVVAYTAPSTATNFGTDLVIKNFGLTAARDVRLDLTPWPERAELGGSYSRVGIPEVFPILAPGQEWRTSWEVGTARLSTTLPDRHEGSLSYRGIDDRPLVSPVVLDLGIDKEREWLTVESPTDMAKALSDIRDTIKMWTEGFRDGLKVYTRSGDAKDERDRERADELRARLEGQRARLESQPDADAD